MSTPALDAQAAAVERAACNLRGHVTNLRTLVIAGKRPELELRIAEGYLPQLEAAALTMRELAKSKQLVDV